MNNTVIKGEPLASSKKALIMIHGRGAAAQDILSIANYLNVDGFSLVAPQAPGNTWYPLSFLAKPTDNEPHLTNALNTISETVSYIENQGIGKENIYFLGFSQGACLTAEFTARNAAKYGGIVIFTGGVIGDKIYDENYTGNFDGTPVFIGTGDPDFHVPVERANDTAELFKTMGATVNVKVYDNIPHTIIQDEIEQANQLVFKN
ncbi:phospholipase [Flavobacterium sp. Sd200]|uniref:alpha/beta hydrolase n=1 Tax=Flavobacterium sp. Sd200 TaxID=2692211 RepID=UPI0013709351|nr:dienelactone hydrolase family protein [Flavobacterium sp. Sd200]MXN90546.1 phospholipase [Flavobacterium sp. Sd200]